MSIPPGNFNALLTQRPIPNPTIDSGIKAGGVFDGRGHDFLDPDDILGNVDDFSQGITPVSSNNPIARLVGTNPINQNANSTEVLGSTQGTLNKIFSPNFGANILATPTGASAQDLANFNPLIWENPNSANVLIGTMDAADKIFGGGGVIQPNLIPPLFPFISQPVSPFSGSVTPVLSQGQLFPNTFLSGSPFFQPVVSPVITGNVSATAVALQAQIQLLRQDIARLEAERANGLKSDQTGDEDKARVQGIAASLQRQIDQKKLQLQTLQQALLQTQLQGSGTNAVVIGNNPGQPISGTNGASPFGNSNTMMMMAYSMQVVVMSQFASLGNGSASGSAGFPQSQSVMMGQSGGFNAQPLRPTHGVQSWIT